MGHSPKMVNMWVKEKEITFPLNFFKVHMTAQRKIMTLYYQVYKYLYIIHRTITAVYRKVYVSQYFTTLSQGQPTKSYVTKQC